MSCMNEFNASVYVSISYSKQNTLLITDDPCNFIVSELHTNYIYIREGNSVIYMCVDDKTISIQF